MNLNDLTLESIDSDIYEDDTVETLERQVANTLSRLADKDGWIEEGLSTIASEAHIYETEVFIIFMKFLKNEQITLEVVGMEPHWRWHGVKL